MRVFVVFFTLLGLSCLLSTAGKDHFASFNRNQGVSAEWHRDINIGPTQTHHQSEPSQDFAEDFAEEFAESEKNFEPKEINDDQDLDIVPLNLRRYHQERFIPLSFIPHINLYRFSYEILHFRPPQYS